jgi:hypothetical protein
VHKTTQNAKIHNAEIKIESMLAEGTKIKIIFNNPEH